MSETVKIKERENGLKSKIKKLQAKHASQVKTNNWLPNLCFVLLKFKFYLLSNIISVANIKF